MTILDTSITHRHQLGKAKTTPPAQPPGASKLSLCMSDSSPATRQDGYGYGPASSASPSPILKSLILPAANRRDMARAFE